jgi:hypothetical protein
MGDYDPVGEVTREALHNLRSVYTWWLTADHTSDSERELARMKLGLIDNAVSKL